MASRQGRYVSGMLVASAIAACGSHEDLDVTASDSMAVGTSFTGVCRATNGDNPLIDDMEDGDYRLDASSQRLGVWYTFHPTGACVQTPLVDATHRFVPSGGAGAQGSQFAAATTGLGCTSPDWSGGGIGVQFLASYDATADRSVACADGYDASVFSGLSFALKSSVPVRLQVCTKAVTDSNCHGFDIAARGSEWRTVSVPWIQLLQEDWGPTTQRVPFDPSKIVSIQFKATRGDFDFAVDDVRFMREDAPVDAGQASTAYHAFKASAVTRALLQTEYDNWKSRHLVVCGDGSADVRKDGDEAVSEGTGYGMLLSALADDKATFDALLKGADRRRNGLGMMGWRFHVCGGVIASGGATDGDLDMAMALIQADAKWSGYRAKAEVLISALKQYATAECDGRTVLRPGDSWGACPDGVDRRINPSYFAPGYYRVFAAYVPNQRDFWNDLTSDTYALLAKYQERSEGLFPDWGYSDGTALGNYGYEACRIPWRIATDYAWSGDGRAKAVLQKMHDAVVHRGGVAPASSERNSCFLGGFALTATAVSASETDAWFGDWIQSIPQGPDPWQGDNPYYQGTLRVLYLALAGGHAQPMAPVALDTVSLP